MTGVLNKAPIERLPGVSGRGTGHLLITFRLCRAERLYGNIWLHTVFSCRVSDTLKGSVYTFAEVGCRGCDRDYGSASDRS